jgi:hypothetical protein
MPKDPTKNLDRYKIRGGTLNEFELAENQEAYEGQNSKRDGKLIPGTPPEKAKKATKSKKASKKPTKKATKTVATRGASAKKLAAQKAAKKK